MDVGNSRRASHNSREEGWRWFGAWAIIGGLGALALLSAMSVGLFLIPLVAIGAWLVGRRARIWPELLGLVLGAAFLCLAIGWGAQRLPHCSEERPPFPPLQRGETQTYSCTDARALPWIVVGSVLAVSGTVAYGAALLLLRTRSRGSTYF